jgi:predicted dehydrogenase
LEEGAIGQLNYAEGFWARNDPIGAWQYAIPEDAFRETVDWDLYLGDAPERPFGPLRIFRWRNYRDYGTGVSGDLFVHLFSSLHFVTSSMGPQKIMAQGGLRYWKDGREVPDVLLGMFDYPETDAHPPFNLSLRVNFVDGTSGSTFLRLVGSEGAMDVTWTEVVLRRNKSVDPTDVFLQMKPTRWPRRWTSVPDAPAGRECLHGRALVSGRALRPLHELLQRCARGHAGDGRRGVRHACGRARAGVQRQLLRRQDRKVGP